MVPGLRVVHPVLGAGVVARVVDGGRKCVVRFDGRPSVPEVLPVDSLGYALQRPIKLRSEVAPGPGEEAVDTMRPRARANRQSLEALRLGVVPVCGLHALTVGRHAELARVEELLDRRAGMMVLSGGYGSGKTHMVELAEAEALQRGFLVARATFDPVEVPPSHPLRLYAALMRQLSYPDGSGTGLRPLLESLGDSARHLTGNRWHRWLSAALFAVTRADGELSESVVDFVEGRSRDDLDDLSRRLAGLGYRRPRMLALPDYRTFGQVMAYLLGGVATWAADAGYKGLLLLLDEAEYLDQLAATARQMAENVLKYLAVGALPADALAFDPCTVYRGGHATHRSIPTRFSAGQPLAVLCAFTPNAQVDYVLSGIFRAPEHRIELEPVRASLLPVLAEKVFGMVRQVYPELDPEPDHRQRVTRALAMGFRSGDVSTTRQAARMVVEFWDLYRVDPSRALAALAP